MRASLSVKREPDKKEVLRKAFVRMTEKLGLSRREVSMVIGISEASLSRLYDNNRSIDPDSKEGELALLLLRLYRSLDALFASNEQHAQLWLRAENLHLSGIPIELIKTIQGLIMVTAYLDAMRGKM